MRIARVATQGVWGIRSPARHRGCHKTGAVTRRLRCFITIKKVGAAIAVPTYCGDIEIRTLDPLLAKQVLYQLSYTPEA